MKIVESGEWYRFSVPIPVNEKETEREFLQKAMKCIAAFYVNYTSMSPLRKHLLNPCVDARLESLTEQAWNFSSFELNGMKDCDVGFYVGTHQKNSGNIGIDILADENNIERKPMIDFLRERWRIFRYKF